MGAMIRVAVLLMLIVASCHSAGPRNMSEDTMPPGQDALQRENEALRQRIAELEHSLDHCLHGHPELATTPAPVGAPLGQQLQGQPDLSELQDLPLGTYKASCSECRIASRLVTCRCPQKASVTSSAIATMSSNNLTGGWVIPFADGGRLAGEPQDYLRVVAGPRSNLTDVVLICGKLPLNPHYPASCRSPGQSVEYKSWNRGTGTLHTDNSVLAVQLDNGWRGCAQALGSGEDKRSELYRQLQVVQLQWLNCTTLAPLRPTVENWTRLPDTGLLTSLWLPSCANYTTGKNASENLALSNSDGMLSCEWRLRPPPRVGNLSTRGFGDAAHTCRVLSSYTFLAPQYKASGDPLATYPLLNDGNKTTEEILDGSTWTSFTADRTLGGDTFEFTATAIHVATPAESSGYSVRCSAGGPDPSISCNPYRPEFDDRGTAGSWHTANLSISLVSSVAGVRSAEVDFVPGGALSSHSLSGTLSADLRQIDWQS
eukprot:COSAG02_NODE_7654_length_2911_cov_1.512447_1_plen_485_part_10